MQSRLRIELHGKESSHLAAKEVALLTPVLADGPLEPGLHWGDVVCQIVTCGMSTVCRVSRPQEAEL